MKHELQNRVVARTLLNLVESTLASVAAPRCVVVDTRSRFEFKEIQPAASLNRGEKCDLINAAVTAGVAIALCHRVASHEIRPTLFPTFVVTGSTPPLPPILLSPARAPSNRGRNTP